MDLSGRQMPGRESPGSARRRRERVALALSAAYHHSFNRKEYTMKVAADEFRAQKTDRAQGGAARCLDGA